jgi:serralysin
MATVSDITITPLSGLNHIDALLDTGPDWNFLPNAGNNTILYTFSVSSGNEKDTVGQEAFTFAQQTAARSIFTYLQQETGIKFVETTNGSGAQIHLANMNLQGSNVTGLCSWAANYSFSANNTLASYSANAYVYLDNVEFRSENLNLVAGTGGYQTLLHEMGHALGLKHPFYEKTDSNEPQIVLPAAEDNTSNTLMSYTQRGAPQSTFSPYDIAALNWLYGRDGLGGALGIGSTSGARYITGSNKNDTLTGTQFNDTFQGNGGNDMINGGEGTDTVIFGGNRNAYSFSNLANGSLAVAGVAGTTTLQSIETLQFADMTVARADIADTTAPAAPVLGVTMNSNGYSRGATPIINGSAEAGSTVNVYINDTLVATVVAGADNLWSARSGYTLPDGLNYRATATATDIAGNISAKSPQTVFHVDATAPAVPTLGATLAAGGNQPVFSGSGEAGTTIQIFNLVDSSEIGRTVVGADGRWQVDSVPLPNGNYQINIASIDKADNATTNASAQTVVMTINNPLNQTGDAANNTFTAAPGNAAINGGGGRDTFVVNGVSDNYVVDRGVYGVTVFDKTGQNGTDNLINVERIKFNDTMVALDIDGNAGQIYRLYQAAYDRVPDQPGLKYWIDAMDTGNFTLTQISNFFIDQKETVDLYGANPSNRDFVYKLYNHVLHREPEPEGANWWIERMDSNVVTRAQTLEFFSEGFENKAQVIGSIDNGIEYPLV